MFLYIYIDFYITMLLILDAKTGYAELLCHIGANIVIE